MCGDLGGITTIGAPFVPQITGHQADLIGTELLAEIAQFWL